ncbi:MAG TPA: hypothetical protein VFS41_06925 [Edaphobacter sp.]|nr:hypothetical protein [Edaphobacter sp.]
MTTEGKEPDVEKQYGHVLAEYRFQVQLNWDRTKHYFTFNTALLGIAVALYKESASGPCQAGVAALLLIAALNSFHGAFAVKRGHDYYRRVRETKAALEEKLGLATIAILSTPGMLRDGNLVAEWSPGMAAGRFGKITAQAFWLLCLIGALAAVGAIYAGYSSSVTFGRSERPVSRFYLGTAGQRRVA